MKRSKKIPDSLRVAIRVVDMYFKDIPRHVRDNWKAFCARRRWSMKKRLLMLMISDCNQDIEDLQKTKRVRG
jgi:hypothetical protein